MKLKKLAFVPDTHVPYHDERAFKLFLKSMKAFKPHALIIGGDFADFYSVSSHDKNPTRVSSLQEEVEQVNIALDRLDALGIKEKYFVEGNHEWRLQRYLQTKAPELFEMSHITIPALFELKERGYKFTPYKQHLKVGKLYVTHDTGTAGKFAHYKSQADFEDNVVINHTHRLGYTVVGNAKGKPHVGAMFGWLGDPAQVDYMHNIKAMRDWAQGFGIGYMEPNGNVHLRPVPIIDYKVIIEGKLIKG